jgi:hypothetical protein
VENCNKNSSTETHVKSLKPVNLEVPIFVKIFEFYLVILPFKPDFSKEPKSKERTFAKVCNISVILTTMIIHFFLNLNLHITTLYIMQCTLYKIHYKCNDEISYTNGANKFCFLSSLPLLPPATSHPNTAVVHHGSFWVLSVICLRCGLAFPIHTMGEVSWDPKRR